ncbi:hypothetical protein SSP35_03_02400 [Streptomyces sp. NBRC 110611]|nr:hypothetical protein SSP35_03_02400 [Streptomyces sp. NBRC 110611]
MAPLPDELSGPVRDFAAGLRRMHGELGYSLKELESRLPASRSSLSRYLRGQSLPDERLLVQWCKLSFTGEDRLPTLVDLLHRAQEVADAGEQRGVPSPSPSPPPSPEEGGASGAGTPDCTDSATAGPALPAGRRRLRLVFAALGTAAVLAGAALVVPALTKGNGATGGGGARADAGVQGSPATPPGAGSARITVHNVERACQRPHTEYCALGLARDPYRPYRRSNIVGHAWHGDELRAVCRIADGVTVTDEVGEHSSIWFRLDHDGEPMWVPGIRIRPEQLENTALPSCPD